MCKTHPCYEPLETAHSLTHSYINTELWRRCARSVRLSVCLSHLLTRETRRVVVADSDRYVGRSEHHVERRITRRRITSAARREQIVDGERRRAPLDQAEWGGRRQARAEQDWNVLGQLVDAVVDRQTEAVSRHIVTVMCIPAHAQTHNARLTPNRA